MSRAKKRMTNDQFVKSLMTYSKYGALSQAFVMEAIGRYADMVSEIDPEQINNGFINGEAWVGVAKEVRDRLREHYKN